MHSRLSSIYEAWVVCESWSLSSTSYVTKIASAQNTGFYNKVYEHWHIIMERSE